jgi:hypothetical protein
MPGSPAALPRKKEKTLSKKTEDFMRPKGMSRIGPTHRFFRAQACSQLLNGSAARKNRHAEPPASRRLPRP